jgi:hypothetical protein
MIDARHVFSEYQLITGDTISTYSIKLPATALLHHMDQGVKKFRFKATVGVADFAGCTSLITSLQDSADGTTYTNTEIVSADVAQATLVAGYVILNWFLPVDILQWIAVYYDDTGEFSGGGVNAWLDVE